MSTSSLVAELYQVRRLLQQLCDDVAWHAEDSYEREAPHQLSGYGEAQEYLKALTPSERLAAKGFEKRRRPLPNDD